MCDSQQSLFLNGEKHWGIPTYNKFKRVILNSLYSLTGKSTGDQTQNLTSTNPQPTQPSRATQTVHIQTGKLSRPVIHKLRPTGQKGKTGVSLFSIHFPLMTFSLTSPTQVCWPLLVSYAACVLHSILESLLFRSRIGILYISYQLRRQLNTLLMELLTFIKFCLSIGNV